MSSGRREFEGPHGAKLVVEQRGDAGEPTLVWLHGEWGVLPGDAVFEGDVAEGWRLIAPHHPGWGVSTGEAAFPTLQELALAYWWMLDTLGDVTSPVLAGHGLGAALAAEMAAQQPHRVSALLLVAPAGIWDDAIGGADIFSLLPKDVAPMLYADPQGEAAQAHFPPAKDAHDKAMAGVRRVQALAPASRYIFPLPETGIARRLYRLNAPREVPVTVLWGARDGVVPAGLAEHWRAALPQLRVEVLEDVAHMVPVEAPSRLKDELAALRGVAQPA